MLLAQQKTKLIKDKSTYNIVEDKQVKRFMCINHDEKIIKIRYFLFIL